MPRKPSLAPGLFAGRYAVERLLGEGATATVHLARDTERGIAVAIKILRPELAESTATTRFLKEIRRTAGLQHSHILSVLDSGEHDGRPYFVLQYMEGGTLRHVLDRREGGLEFPKIFDIARTIGQALDYAHAQGLIHLDVKPENILFTNGEACLGDFGIAHALVLSGSGDTSSRNIIRGTPAYMSPEQAAGSIALDGRSDIYSLACVIYEMITGMQAFIGPTPQAVISQRFVFTPREVRVYRPSAPLAVDAVLAKAFAVTPADRYRTAGELIAALQEAIALPGPPPNDSRGKAPSWSRLFRRPWVRPIALALVVAVGTAFVRLFPALVRVPLSRAAGSASVDMDTTRLALLPLEHDGARPSPWRDEDLLHQGLARWRGLSVVDQFQIADALGRRGPIRNTQDAVAIAASLKAGRYIRGRVTATDSGWSIAASLYDATRATPLYAATQRVPTDISGATAAYGRLADSLLLRGAVADPLPVNASGTRSLPAVQAFTKAQLALDGWDLDMADSLFQLAVTYDPEDARASLWLAQVRAWQNESPTRWRTVAERAAAIEHQLNDRERRLASALVLLARGAYDEACRTYDGLALRNDHDFAALFGLGQCQMMNRLVYPDVKSPSGWSFHSSAHRAMRSYERAFEMLPSVHRGYQRGAFSRVRLTLLVSSEGVIGYGAADSAHFYARPGWIGDTLALIPMPWRVVAAGGPNAMPPGFATAMRNRRDAFRRIASSWSAAYPGSPGAKYAVAVALQVLGDPAAIDTIRLARSLAPDASHRRRLAAAEVLLLLQFGLPDRTDRLREAAVLADSLLSASNAISNADGEVLSQVAMLFGACARAEALTRQIPMSAPTEAIAPQLLTESQALLARVGTGCRASDSTINAFASAIDRGYREQPAERRGSLVDIWASRPILIARGRHPDALRVLATTTPDPFYVAQWMYARGNIDSARIVFRAVRTPPADTLAPPTPDMTYPKARLAVDLGDTLSAIVRLERTLMGVVRYDPNVLSANMRAASLVQSMILRADLAMAQRDTATVRRWATAATILWSHADDELQPEVKRMKRYINLIGSR